MEQHTQAAAYQTSQLLLELRWSTQLGWYTLQYSHPFRRTVQLVIFALQRTLAVELLHPVQALALVRALILSPAAHKSHSHSHIGCIAGGGRGGGEYLLHTIQLQPPPVIPPCLPSITPIRTQLQATQHIHKLAILVGSIFAVRPSFFLICCLLPLFGHW